LVTPGFSSAETGSGQASGNTRFAGKGGRAMKKVFSFYVVLGMLFLLAVALNAYTEAAGKQYSFVTSAGQAGMAEVALANMALAKSQNEDVRQFAQMMIDDHTKAGDELKALAAGKKYGFPPQESASQKAVADSLSNRSGAAFDKEYARIAVADHEAAVKLFSAQANSGADTEVKAWAAAILPTLKMHLEKAEALNAKVK
jgi:putative membrane protein